MEKFDPSDPKYQKVEDLPLEIQDRFKDVEGGFVREDAHTKVQAQQDVEVGELALQPRSILQKTLFAIGGEPDFSHPTTSWLNNEDSLLSKVLTELWKKEADKYIDKLNDNDILQSRELYRAYLTNWIDRQIDLARMEAFEKQREELGKLGHTGHLVKNILDYPNKARKVWGPQDDTIIEGEIDDKYVKFTETRNYSYENGTYTWYKFSGTVDSINLKEGMTDECEAGVLYNTYGPLALNIGDFDRRKQATLEKALSTLDDKTIDVDVRERYQQFQQSMNRKTTAETKNLANAEERDKEEKRTISKEQAIKQMEKEERTRQEKETLERRNNIIASVHPKQK